MRTPPDKISHARETGNQLSPAGPTALTTSCDHLRDVRPLDFPALREPLDLDASPAQALVGTPKPVLARATISSGSGCDGVAASAYFPAPGLIRPITGASVSSSVVWTRGTRISTPCAIPAQSASRRS